MMKSPISNHLPQKEIWQSQARFKIVVCGRRFGKTFLAGEMLLKASDQEGANIVYVAPTKQQAKDIFWQHIKKRYKDLKWACNINEAELSVQRRNRSKLFIRSAEKPDRLRGLGIDFIVFDECAEYRSLDIWYQVARPALSDRYGKAVFLCTPKGFNQVYELYQAARTETNWAAFNYKTIDSPFFQTTEGIAELDEAKRNLSERDFKQEYEGEFQSYSGRIYYAFDRIKNHTDYEFNKNNGPIYIGQDFNRSPMSSSFSQFVDGIKIQFGELFVKSGDTKQTCERIKEIFPTHKIIFRPDATGSRKTSNYSFSDFDIIKSYGFDIESGKINPKIIDRWASVNTAHEKKYAMINVKNCPQTVKDRETLVYKQGSCEADLRDPFAGHMADASDYDIFADFPIIKNAKVRTSYY